MLIKTKSVLKANGKSVQVITLRRRTVVAPQQVAAA